MKDWKVWWIIEELFERLESMRIIEELFEMMRWLIVTRALFRTIFSFAKHET